MHYVRLPCSSLYDKFHVLENVSYCVGKEAAIYASVFYARINDLKVALRWRLNCAR